MRRIALFGLVLALSSCRLVAGIEDIQLTSTTDGGSIDGGPDGGLAKPEILTSAAGEKVAGLLVNNGFVYARTATSIWRCPIVGCAAPEVLVPSATPLVNDFLVLGTELYYSTSEGTGTIRAIGLDGKNGRLYRTVPNVSDLATDGTQIFWSEVPTAGGNVVRCATPTCATPSTVMTVDYQDFKPTDLEVFNGNVNTVAYAANGIDEPMYKCALSGSCGANPQIFIADATTSSFSPTATRLFFTSDNAYGFYDPTGKKTILGNGELNSGSNWVSGDDAFVYANAYQSVSSTEEFILRAPVTGGAPTVVATAGTFDAGVVSGGYVYFSYLATAVVLARLKE